jgi:hypothetical protein
MTSPRTKGKKMGSQALTNNNDSSEFIPDPIFRSMVRKFIDFYSASTPTNPTRKSVKDWSSEDLKFISDADVTLIRTLLTQERYDISDAMTPSSMSRADFLRAVLRESAQRGIADDNWLVGTTPSRSRQITVSRAPIGLENPVPQQVRELASVVAIRDAAEDILVNNANAFRFKPEVASALGYKPQDFFRIINDAKAYDFGYTVGSMNEYRQDNGLRIRATSPLPPQEVQARYCAPTNLIFEPGRALDNRDSFLAGFLQARVDSRTNFEPVNDHIGLFAECPPAPKTPAAPRQR